MHTGTSCGILYIHTNYTTILKGVTAGEKKCPYGGKGYKDLLWWLPGCESLKRTNGFFNTQGYIFSPIQVHVFTSRISEVIEDSLYGGQEVKARPWGWADAQYDWCLCMERKFGDENVFSKKAEEKKEDSHVPQEVPKLICPSPWWFVVSNLQSQVSSESWVLCHSSLRKLIWLANGRLEPG